MPTWVAIGESGLGRRYEVSAGTTVGRLHTCDIQLVDPEVSKMHARLVAAPQGLAIEDLGSRNGVLVNGVRIDRPTVLCANAVVTIGSARFLVDPDVEILPTDDGQAVVLVEPSRTQSSTPRRQQCAADGPTPLCEALLVPALLAAGEAELLDAVMRRLQREVAFDAAALLLPHESLWVSAAGRTLTLAKEHFEQAWEGDGLVVIDHDASDVALGEEGTSCVHRQRQLALLPLRLGAAKVALLVLARAAARPFAPRELATLQSAELGLAAAVTLARRLSASKRSARVGSAAELIGASAALNELRLTLAKAAPSTATVLLLGETGTGKEVAARLLHEQSQVRDGPFIAVNCGAIPESLIESELFGHERGAFSGADRQVLGKLELADHGTLFLDEIAELPLAMQVKLLRALEERSFYRVGGSKPVRVSIRVVAATHRNLKEAVAAGRFREDLYYRLDVIQVTLPPLRERGADIVLLARHFIARFAAELAVPAPELSPPAERLLMAYGWPGNIRELRNVIERTLVLSRGSVIEPHDLPTDLAGVPASSTSRTLADEVAALEQRRIAQALRECGGKKIAAAKLLGISRPTLDKKIDDYGLGGSE